MTDTVGRSVQRLEGEDKVRGRAVYVDDIERSGMLHAAFVLSPYPHARIERIDLAAALEVAGVRCVLTGADFPHLYGQFVKDETALARDVVRYVGEPVAVVAADDLATARYAAALVQVDYEELPAVATVDEALAPGAPLVHPDFALYGRRHEGALPPNVYSSTVLAEGNAATAFAAADVVVEGTYETQAQVHCYLEPCGAVAEVDDGGRVVIWSACQSVFRVQAVTAEVLGLPMSRIRAIATRVGGAFGGKSEVTVQPVAAALALRTRRPVKVVLPRNDDFLMMRTRHPARVWMRTAATRDGTLVAREARVLLDGGAYADDSSAVIGFALLMARGPYRISHVHFEGQAVYTNRLRAAGFRGFGNPQVTFAGESQLDELAARLGIDPIELRLKNAIADRDRWVGGEPVDGGGLKECLEKVRTASGWLTRPPVAGSPGRRRGLGVACVAHICGLLSTAAIVRVLEDGTVTLNTGAVDLGEGADTVLAQICAETLRIPLGHVNLATPDTDGSPYNWSTAGSRITYMVGRVVGQAATEARTKIFTHAAAMLECAPEDLELRPGGRVGVVGVAGHEVSFGAISERAHWSAGGPIVASASLMFEGAALDPKRTHVSGNGLGRLGMYVFGAQVVEVEVDEVTGVTKVERVWSAHDVGRAINPAAVRGQITGGVAQGIGFALYEELAFDAGRPVTATLADYKLPGARDLPDIEAIIVERPEASHPFGAKGVGEPPIVGVAPAIANAIAAATGARLRRLPMTPQRVLAELDKHALAAALPRP